MAHIMAKLPDKYCFDLYIESKAKILKSDVYQGAEGRQQNETMFFKLSLLLMHLAPVLYRYINK